MSQPSESRRIPLPSTIPLELHDAMHSLLDLTLLLHHLEVIDLKNMNPRNLSATDYIRKYIKVYRREVVQIIQHEKWGWRKLETFDDQ